MIKFRRWACTSFSRPGLYISPLRPRCPPAEAPAGLVHPVFRYQHGEDSPSPGRCRSHRTSRCVPCAVISVNTFSRDVCAPRRAPNVRPQLARPRPATNVLPKGCDVEFRSTSPVDSYSTPPQTRRDGARGRQGWRAGCFVLVHDLVLFGACSSAPSRGALRRPPSPEESRTPRRSSRSSPPAPPCHATAGERPWTSSGALGSPSDPPGGAPLRRMSPRTNSIEVPSELGTLRLRGDGAARRRGVVRHPPRAIHPLDPPRIFTGRAGPPLCNCVRLVRRAALGGCTTGPVLLLGIVDRPS